MVLILGGILALEALNLHHSVTIPFEFSTTVLKYTNLKFKVENYKFELIWVVKKISGYTMLRVLQSITFIQNV